MTSRRGLQTACTVAAVTFASSAAVCASSAGPVRQIASVSLLCALAYAVWFSRPRRFEAVVPAIGLTLAALILAGLALAAVHVLSTVPVVLATAVATLAAVWLGARHPAAAPGEREARLKLPRLLAVAGVLIFAAATVLAVHHSAASATADADRSSSVAVWAYPSGGQLRIGVEQSAGHGATPLRIVVSRAGAVVAKWDDVRLAPGQTWRAPPLTATGKGPTEVVVLRGGTVVASLSSR